MGKVKYLVMDVDGTLTDGKIYMGRNGEVLKAFSIKDGFAISHILPEYGIVPIIITGRESSITENRCRELGIIELHQGCIDKKKKLLEIAKRLGASINGGIIEECAYIGDDDLDIPAMRIARWNGCPFDASNEVKKQVDYVCKNNGGDGAVREFIEWLISK